MQISTLLNLLVLASAAQAAADKYDKHIQYRPKYDNRPGSGHRPTRTIATYTVSPAPTTNAQATTATTISDTPVTNDPNQGTTTLAQQPATGTQSADSAYIMVALRQHNIHRTNHSAPAATWSDALASYAKTVADGCKFQHNTTAGGGGYGQNLAIEGSSDPTLATQDNKIYLARSITNGWYNNEFSAFLPSYYGQPTPDMSNFAAWGHFSQLVWKGSSQIGCATSFCAAGTAASLATWYTVCDYLAAGNIGGGYGDNIGQPLGQPVVTAP